MISYCFCEWSEGCSVVSDSLWPHGLYSPWNSAGQNTGVGSFSLLQGTFLTQGLNPHCRQISYQMSHKGSPRILEWIAYSFSSRSSQSNRDLLDCGWILCQLSRFFTNWIPLIHTLYFSIYPTYVCVYVYSSSVTQLCLTFVTPWTATSQASLSFTISWSLLKFMSIESVMPPKHPLLCCPLLLSPSIFPSIRVFRNESALSITGPKYWSFFSISPSSDYSGLISFSIDQLDLLAVQGTLKSLQHHSSKASVLRPSAFFMFQFSHPYVTTGKKK